MSHQEDQLRRPHLPQSMERIIIAINLAFSIIYRVNISGIKRLVVPLPLMDNLIAWNVWGLNGPNKQEDVRNFLHTQNVKLVALLETKVHKDKMSYVASKVFGGWLWHMNVDYNPKVRIWIAWRGSAMQL